MVKICVLPADTFSLETCSTLLSFTDSCKRAKPLSNTALEWSTLELFHMTSFIFVSLVSYPSAP